jgi:hypothetical protein
MWCVPHLWAFNSTNENIMRTLYFTSAPLFLLAACATQKDAPITITNEITIEDSCCDCGDPCAEDSPCDDEDADADDADSDYDFDGGDEDFDADADDADADYDADADDADADYDADADDADEDYDADADDDDEDADADADDADDPISMVDFRETTEASLELEVEQVDVAFLLDTTSSMSGTANAMASEFGDIVDDLASSITDGAYAYATFDDYNYSPYGSGSDLPFILQQQITTDQALVQVALDGTTIHSGGDGPESAIEGLFQGLTGVGYDQTSDEIYDAAVDVLPFITDVDDAYNGAVTGTYDPTVPGTGIEGGYGFRDGSLPVIVYATDNLLRDADDPTYGTPPAANYTAGSTDVIDASIDMGARLIGVATNSSGPVSQMTDLAIATDSLYEADGDGAIDDPLVFTWSGSSATFRDTIVDAIEGMLDSVTFSAVTAVVTGNSYGFTTNVSPASYSNITVGSAAVSLAFNVEIFGSVPESTIDQTFPLTLEIYGDGTTLLGTQDVTVVVPATP